MEKLSFEQMEEINGGSTYAWVCGGLMGGWGMALSLGVALSGVTVGTSIAITGAWGLASYVICNADSF